MPRTRALRQHDRHGELLEALFDEHARDLLGFFQTRTRCGATSADLVAETFAVAVAKIDRYDPALGEPGAWLWGIAKNQLRHFHRSTAVETKYRRLLAVRTPVVHADELWLLDERLDAEVSGRALVDAIDTLSEPLADAVRARVLDGLPYEEVAARCGCSVGAARVRVSRALSALGSSAVPRGELR